MGEFASGNGRIVFVSDATRRRVVSFPQTRSITPKLSPPRTLLQRPPFLRRLRKSTLRCPWKSWSTTLWRVQSTHKTTQAQSFICASSPELLSPTFHSERAGVDNHQVCCRLHRTQDPTILDRPRISHLLSINGNSLTEKFDNVLAPRFFCELPCRKTIRVLHRCDQVCVREMKQTKVESRSP